MRATWADLTELMGLSGSEAGSAHTDTLLAGTLVRSRWPKAAGTPQSERGAVSSAGMLPNGFDAGRYYRSAHHPKALAMTVFGASDALNSTGLDWPVIQAQVPPDQVSVYAGSSLGQWDDDSARGLLQSSVKGKRASTKMLPFSFPEMPADFINSYMLNSVGVTGHCAGACATFLYNLRLGVQDIAAGRAQVAVVGSVEAPLVPEVVSGFEAMGALANDARLRALSPDGVLDCRQACRPFSDNVGFTLAESAQFLVLMSDQLALQLGATVYGAVPEVFVHADGNKKSISSPGVGNYLTMAKATALAAQLLGDAGLQRTFVQAHGTGTPQNRTTESHILSETATAFGITDWPVTAMKAYLGHPLGPAAGDQIIMSLGVWQEGIIPGIGTIEGIADDVATRGLRFLTSHTFAGLKGEDTLGALINSKGFGGNNASTLVLSPAQSLQMMQTRYGKQTLTDYWHRNETTREQAARYDQSAIQGQRQIRYAFGTSVIPSEAVQMTRDAVHLGKVQVSLPVTTSYAPYQGDGSSGE